MLLLQETFPDTPDNGKWTKRKPEKVTTNIWKLDNLGLNPDLASAKTLVSQTKKGERFTKAEKLMLRQTFIRMIMSYSIDDYCNSMHANTNCDSIIQPSSRHILRVSQLQKDKKQLKPDKDSVTLRFTRPNKGPPIKDRDIANVFGLRRKGTFTQQKLGFRSGNLLNSQRQHHHRKFFVIK